MPSFPAQDLDCSTTMNRSSTTPASLTTPIQASHLRKGSYILIKNHACRIISLSSSKPGKHGHAKIIIMGVDIFTGKKYEGQCPAHANVEVPVVTKREYLVLDIDDDEGDGYMSLWDRERGETKDDIRAPEGEVGERMRRLWKKSDDGRDLWAAVVGAMGVEMVDAVKVGEGK